MAVAFDSDNSKYTYPFCDNGSHRSYTTEAIKIKVGLRLVKKEKLHLNTLVEALCFPTICTEFC